jgi:putative membrane protein
MTANMPEESMPNGSMPDGSTPEALALDAAEERRLHPLSWFFVLIQQLKQFIVPLLVLLFLGRGDRNDLWSMVFICLLAAYSIWQYYTYRFRIDRDSLTIRSGLLERSLRQIPFARIHNVALHQSLLHRIFKVAEVRLESAGGIKPEAEMRVLTLEDALALEALVRRRRSETSSTDSTAASTQHTEADAGEMLVQLSTSEVIRLGLISNRGMLVIAGAFAVLGQISPGLLTKVLRAWLQTLSGYVLDFGRGHEIAAMFSLVVLFVVALRVFSVSLALLHYTGFRLERHGRRLTLERGLLARLRTSTPHRRIQTWTLHEGVLHRVFKRRTLEVSTAVLDNGSHGQPRSLRELAPIGTPALCDSLIHRLLPQAQWPIQRWQPLHRYAGWRLLIPHVLWVLPLSAAGYWNLGVLGAAFVACWLPWGGYLAWRHARMAGYAVDETIVAVRDGWWTRRWRFAEISKLQAVLVKQSPLDRRMGMATLFLDTAGGTGLGAPLVLRYLPEAEARDLQARLVHRISRQRLRW